MLGWLTGLPRLALGAFGPAIFLAGLGVAAVALRLDARLRAAALLVATNLLLLWLTGLANDTLASVGLHLYLGGLLVVFAALRLDPAPGFAATAATALAYDATTAAPFGLSLVLFGLVHATILVGRHGFPRNEPVFTTVATLSLNLFLFIAFSFVLVGANPRPGEAWLRLFVDLLASQITLALVTPWFFALQDRAFSLARLDPATGRPQVG